MSDYLRRFLYVLIIVMAFACFTLAGIKFYDLAEQKKQETKISKPAKKIIKKEEEEKKLSLLMVGDALIHEAVYNAAKIDSNNYDFKPKIARIRPIVQNYDLAFYNQESIIGGKSIGLSTYPRFNSPEEVGDAFLDAGFNLVSLANNHTLDRNEEAIVNSLNYWQDKEVYTAGSYNSFSERDNIKIATKNGITYALLAYTTGTNGLTRPSGKEYYLNVYDEEQARRDIESIRDKVDLLMVSMHFGNEYTLKQTPVQEEIANYLASLGVNIVIGHHPHVIEPITYINDTLVIYSLGNFISGQRTIDQLTGMMVGVDIKKTKDNKVKLENVTATLIYTNTKGYEVIPYNELDESILPNFNEHKEKYSEVINSLGANVLIK